ncbi:hypothetical protein GX51_03276 [Blastomyces parvus]|uniref:Mitochondrial import inner membrane translocase subunit n=1 Tax=Blastomyces parvus TaxID=2060905 RepID=A0A2B7X7P7_9EURO|nr:hypothetical protein GX51_03276 [Blastomyces parvus]
MDALNANEQRELASRMEKKQMKEFMTVQKLSPIPIQSSSTPSVYSNIVQRCFEDCVSDFTTKSLISREQGCVNRCFDKFMKGSERINQRFQEQNAQMMQSGGMGGGK